MAGPAHRSHLHYQVIGIFLMFLFVAFVTYWPTLHNGFVFDDLYQVLNNPWITDFSSIPEIFVHYVWDFMYPWTNIYNVYYRPLMHIVYAIEYFFFALDPWLWHGINILWHGINATLLFFFTRLFLTCIIPTPHRGRPVLIPALIGALMFLVHPLNTEVINWIAAIPELGLFSCVLLSSIFYFLPYTPHRRFISGLFLFLALLFKETGFLLVAFFLFFELFLSASTQPYKTILLSFVRKNIFLFVAMIMVLALRMTTESSPIPGPTKPHALLLLCNALIDGPTILLHYFQKLLFPSNLTFLYPFEILSVKHFPASIMFIVIATALAFVRKNLLNHERWNNLFFTFLFSLSWILFLIGPAFISTVLQVSTLADRYFYLPFVGVSLFIAFTFYTLSGQTKPHVYKIMLCVICIALCILAIVSQKRSTIWFSTATLFEDSIRQNPTNVWPHVWLSHYQIYQGITPSPDNIQVMESLLARDTSINTEVRACTIPALQRQASFLNDNPAQALEWLHGDALSCIKQDSPSVQSSMRRSFGMAHLFLGDIPAAETNLIQAYTLTASMETARSLAQYYCVVGNSEQFQHYAQEARRLGDHTERIALLKHNCATENPQTLFRKLESFRFVP